MLLVRMAGVPALGVAHRGRAKRSTLSSVIRYSTALETLIRRRCAYSRAALALEVGIDTRICTVGSSLLRSGAGETPRAAGIPGILENSDIGYWT